MLTPSNPRGGLCSPLLVATFLPLSRGHVHPVKPLVIDPTDYPLPPLLIRWPQTSPGKASNLPLATPAEMFPVPGWLSQASKALFEKGPVVDDNLVVRDWLPACCAHTFLGSVKITSSQSSLLKSSPLSGLVLLLPSSMANKVWLVITSKVFWIRLRSHGK